jgi:hypothetical protein
MLKRKIELPLETIDHIIHILAGVEEVGKQTIKSAEEKGARIPRKFLSQISRISNSIEIFKAASDEVEIAELEELFALTFDEQTKL